jgi:hypothetical protein
MRGWSKMAPSRVRVGIGKAMLNWLVKVRLGKVL